jgi:PAS domain S-box-containing protein
MNALDETARARLRDALHARREAIAARWYGAIPPAGFVPRDGAEVRRGLAALVDQLIALLLAEPFAPGAARATGAALARLCAGDPAALGRTHAALGEHLLAELPAARTPALRPRLAALLDELATGFGAHRRAAAADEQERAHAALDRARRRAEAALRHERDFSAALLDTTDNPIVVLDRAGRIVRFNHACERLTGYTLAEVRGRPFWELLLPPDELAPVLHVFAELCAGRSPSTHTNHWVTKRGERRLIAWANSTLRDEAGAVERVIATGSDITDRVRAEVALRRFEAGLSPQEREVLPWLAREELSYRQIGAHFGVTGGTIRKHLQGIAQKLRVKAERKVVVAAARERGLL